MAGIADMNLRIGADLSDALSKIDSMRAKVNQLKETNQDLKNNISELNGALSANQKEFNAADKAVQKLIATGKGGSQMAKDLRAQIQNVNSSTAELSTQLKVAQTALSNNNAELKVHSSALTKAENAGNGLASGATKIYSGLRKIAYIIPGMGIAGLISLISGPLIDAFADWYNILTKLSDAQQLSKDSIQNISDITKAANEATAKQTTGLTALYSIATDVNRSMNDRIAAVKELQKEFPDYFKNISQENILNGKAKTSYEALTQAIIANALATSQKAQMDKIGAKAADEQSSIDDLNARRKAELDAVRGNKILPVAAGALVAPVTQTEAQQKVDINNHYDKLLKDHQDAFKNYANQINAIVKNYHPANLDDPTKNSAIAGNGTGGLINAYKVQIDTLTKYRDEIAKTPEEISKLNAQIKILQDALNKLIPKDANKNVQTLAEFLANLKLKLDAISAGKPQIELDTKQAQAEISAINSAIDTLFTKFHKNNSSPEVINLRAEAASLELQIDSAKLQDALQKAIDKDKAVPITIPAFITHIENVNKAESSIGQNTGGPSIDAQAAALVDRLTNEGVKKTVAFDLVPGDDSTKVLSELITQYTSLKKLQETQADYDKTHNKLLSDEANLVEKELGPAFDALFTGILTGSQTAFSSFGEALKNIIVQLAATVLKALALAAILDALGLGGGKGFLGIFTTVLGTGKGHATGGFISGSGTGTSDSIPARLSNGEYVIKASKVRELGVGFFDKLNYGGGNIREMLKDRYGISKFATGGLVSPNSVSTFQRQLIPAISIGGGQTIFISESKIRGQDIVTSYKRASATIARNS